MVNNVNKNSELQTILSGIIKQLYPETKSIQNEIIIFVFTVCSSSTLIVCYCGDEKKCN